MILIFSFSFVILFGAPYLPTLTPQVNIAFDLLNLNKGDTLLELGSGDGKILLAAAKKGYNVIGYELNPLLYAYSILRTLRYKKQVKIYLGNFWAVEWPKADGIFIFLITKHMKKLDNKLETYKYMPIKIASFAFPIPDKEYIKKKGGVYLYKY